MVQSGISHIEIPLNAPDAIARIRDLREITENSFGPRRLIPGAGTVLTLDQVEEVAQAGAEFCLSPMFDEGILAACGEKGLLYIPGVLTPQEVGRALLAGATALKVFPAALHGPDYISMLREPFSSHPLESGREIGWLASGGVRPETIGAYYLSGARLFGVGASLFKPDWIAQGRYLELENAVRRLVAALAEAV